MLRYLMKSKIHKATVTEANLDYIGMQSSRWQSRYVKVLREIRVYICALQEALPYLARIWQVSQNECEVSQSVPQ